jgi:hypothetical protein
MTPSESIIAALTRCPILTTKTLEEFLDGFLDEDLDTLAQMPGTPGQVMAAQFAHYVRSSVALTESYRRDAAVASKLMDTITRLPPVRRRITATTTSRRAAPDDSDASDRQTNAA